MLLILCLIVFCLIAASASAQSNFNRFTFNTGVGLGIGRGDVASFVGNSFNGVGGAGFNFNRIFGVDGEYMFYDLNFRPSVIRGQSLPGASGHMQSFSLDGIVNAPYHVGKLGAYGIFGVGFYRRTVSLAHSQPLQVGSVCQPTWAYWWDIQCVNNNIGTPLGTVFPAQTLSSFSKIAGGFNFGGGVTYRLSPHFKLYVEGRYHRAYTSDVQTIVMPITVGLRW